MKKILIVFSFGLFCITACSGIQTQNTTASNTANTGSAEQAGAAGSDGKADVDKAIRKVDFKNFTYEPFCAGEESEKVTVKNGEYSKETKEKDSDFVDHFYFNVFDITYGDVDGDNSEDAIVLSVCNTGGTGNFSEGFVFTMKNGKASLLTRIEGGDRAYGGLRSAKVESGLVVVEANDVGEAGGACCPEFVVTTKYKWDGKALKKSGTESRKELYPEERVSFPKGASKTTIKVTVDENKRYVLGARAGQTLNVSIDTDKASVSLIKGDADVTDGTNGFSARLSKNGDYTIQVQNISDKPTAVTVTIEIR
jgi:hypothetical protein